jgi:hypothetical protein
LRAHGCQYSDDSVAYLSSGTRVPGCQDNEDSVGNDATVVMNVGMTVLATKQIVAMNVAYLSSGMRVPGCQGDDDSVGKEADSGNERCLP